MADFNDTIFGNLPPAPWQGPWNPNAPPDWRNDPYGLSDGPFPDVRNVRPPMLQGFPQGYTPRPVQPYINAQNMPMPSWMPPELQRYIQSRPSYSEGQAQGPTVDIAGNPSWPGGTSPVQGEPFSQTPQIDDIRRLFRERALGPGRPNPMTSQQLRMLMRLPNFGGFTGGQGI